MYAVCLALSPCPLEHVAWRCGCLLLPHALPGPLQLPATLSLPTSGYTLSPGDVLGLPVPWAPQLGWDR